VKVIKVINQNIPIWSFLCGDHALIQRSKLISPKLLDDPDFLSPIENRLRYEIFKSKRGYILDELEMSTSFSVVKLSEKDFADIESPFSHVSFDKFIRKYDRAYSFRKGFRIRRRRWFKNDVTKKRESVKSLRDMGEKIKKACLSHPPISFVDVLDTRIRNEEDIVIALNRGMIVKKPSGKLKIVDGTHRIGSWYWMRHIMKYSYLPDEIYAFYFEEG
jgi:hypothetical protein